MFWKLLQQLARATLSVLNNRLFVQAPLENLSTCRAPRIVGGALLNVTGGNVVARRGDVDGIWLAIVECKPEGEAATAV